MNRQKFVYGWVKKKYQEPDQKPEEIPLGTGFYKLELRRVVTCSATEWAGLFETNGRTIDRTTVGQFLVSTVFLGIDSSFGYGPPSLFETMVFKESNTEEVYRCSTYYQAEAMHKQTVARISHENNTA